MRETIDQATVINRLKVINNLISEIVNNGDFEYTANEENRLSLLLINKNRYQRMLLKTINN